MCVNNTHVFLNVCKFEFIFDDPDSTAVGQAVGYVNSDCAKFDAQVRNLKNLLYKSKSTV